eukprot:TRINITY_DN2071_c0_g1_i1.p1 TRINITY_DN2071_c0_g1~~TRINITY_DN2071_c0_g1_i1.p1  ORF type:complete len:125 (+),score=4.04 TRINITY_DN2071_c0_g1_i1:38-412(+)
MEKSVCRHWHMGRCRLGEMCKFSHPEQADTPVQDVNVAKKPKWCRHMSLEYCRFNGGCVYWHVEEYEATPVDERPRLPRNRGTQDVPGVPMMFPHPMENMYLVHPGPMYFAPQPMMMAHSWASY